jgi:SulP family sulfate permease
MAALAALLLVVAKNMSEARHFARLVRIAPRSDAVVLLTCCLLTVALDMVVAVGVGVVLAALLFMRRMAELTNVRLEPDAGREVELPPGVHVYRIAGPLFFGAANRAIGALEPGSGAVAVILDMERVPVIDATGMVALESLVRTLEHAGCKIIFAGVSEGPRAYLERAGIVRVRGRVGYAPDVDTALSMAMLHGIRLEQQRSRATAD